MVHIRDGESLKAGVERTRWVRETESVMGYMGTELGREEIKGNSLVSSLSN